MATELPYTGFNPALGVGLAGILSVIGALMVWLGSKEEQE